MLVCEGCRGSVRKYTLILYAGSHGGRDAIENKLTCHENWVWYFKRGLTLCTGKEFQGLKPHSGTTSGLKGLNSSLSPLWVSWCFNPCLKPLYVS